MKLTEQQKRELEPELWDITQRCYTGVEVPDRGYFERVVLQGDVWVVIPIARIAGYALVTPDYQPCPLLRSIAVIPERRKQGIGLRLLEQVAEHYRTRAVSKIILHCKVDNPAQKLYFDAGYRVRTRIVNYYAPEGDGLEMELVL